MIKSGVTEYDKAVVEIYFPKGQACCAVCPLMETYARKQCRRTGEYLIDDKSIGGKCPLHFVDEEGEVK